MVNWDDLEQLQNVDRGQLEAPAKFLLNEIDICEGVLNSTICVKYLPSSNKAFILFDMDTGDCPTVTQTTIQQIEPLILIYDQLSNIGIKSPISMRLTRRDFPRDIGHAYFTPTNEPVYPCLFWSSIEDHYDLAGIRGILSRILDFLIKARTGTLNSENWHPVLSMCEDKRSGIVEISQLQELSLKFNGKYVIGLADVTKKLDDIDLSWHRFFTKPLFHEEGPHNHILISKSKDRVLFPWILVAQNNDKTTEDLFFRDFKDFKDLRESAKTVFGEQLEDAINAIEINEISTRRSYPQSDKAIGIILAVRRPTPLEDTSVFLSENLESRLYELHTYVAHNISADTNLIDANSPIIEIIPFLPPTASLFKKISGLSLSESTIILGIGALGSVVFNNMLRSGSTKIGVADHDTILPHNAARHITTCALFPHYKINIAKNLSNNLCWHGQNIVDAPFDYENLLNIEPIKIKNGLSKYEQIIDCTANPRIRRLLSTLKEDISKDQIRLELYNVGKLGLISFCRAADNLDLQDIYYHFVTSAVNNKTGPAYDWLKAELINKNLPSELVIGQGCASLTTVMPIHIIQQHGGAFTSLISKTQDKNCSGYGINKIDENGFPLGFSWCDVAPMKIIQNGDWQVRISNTVFNEIINNRINRLPNETGGYLFGAIDFDMHRITVMESTFEPGSSTGTPTSFKLAPLKEDTRAPVIYRRSTGRIYCVGSWHSHPTNDATPSARDIQTHEKHSTIDELVGIPSLMLIIAHNDINSLVGNS